MYRLLQQFPQVSAHLYYYYPRLLLTLVSCPDSCVEIPNLRKMGDLNLHGS
jgi:hypothetical protein